MVDELLPYYDRELRYIRRLAAEFAEAHPNVAKQLRLTADAVEDPYVARLIEGFAYLNARIRHKLDDDFPELTDALLEVLYPHYLNPTPSMAIVQFKAKSDLASVYKVPPGTTMESEAVSGDRCRFRTAYPVELWPIDLTAASLTGRPLVAPANPKASRAVATLRLTLRTLGDELTFSELGLDRIRVFLRGQPGVTQALYELILNNCISIALAESAADPNAIILPPDRIKPVGFERDDGLLPYPARSFLGYRLLTEYFSFPEKFLFFDLTDLQARLLLDCGKTLEVFLYLDRSSTELERSLAAENFALGCTPMVNLYEQRAEPIQLTQTVSEYRVVPDVRRQQTTEVYSIDRVTATAPDGTKHEFLPFYSVKHATDARRQTTFWHANRRRSAVDGATEVFLSLVDLDFQPAAPADWIVSVETTCLNRDLPARLPYGGGHPRLQLGEASAAIDEITCLTAPTATLRTPQRQGGRWRLLSHLNLNHLSLTDDELGVEALREILRLYDFRDSAETRAMIDSILGLRTRRGAARAPNQDMGAFCRGIDVEILFDQARYAGGGVFLLAMILERFVALYCSINAFTRLTARVQGRSEVLRRWAPRAGEQIIL